MKIDDPKIVTLRAMVTAAMEELDWAVKFYEVWKIAADDNDLHARMGTSFATNAFLITRTALRREMLLALMRLWDAKSKDKDKKNVRMDWIADAVSDRQVIDALALARSEKFAWPGVFEGMRAELDAKAVEVISLTRKYMTGGSHYAAREKLIALRHQKLAHRQIAATAESEPDENEIEEFYGDSAKLVQLLTTLVNATAFDPEDFAGVYRHHATFFWAGARGEQTEGHPNYPKQPPPQRGAT